MPTKRKKVLPATKTKISVLVDVEKTEPQNSIAMGTEGPGGSYRGVKFTSTMDMFGRGLLVSYLKPDGATGAYSINIVPIIKAVIERDTQ